MGAREKRPRGLVERTLPRPRGLHGSWLAPASARAQHELSRLDPSFPEDFFAPSRDPLVVDVQTSTAMTHGLPLEVLSRHHQLFAWIQNRAQRRLDIAFKRDEERKRKQPRRQLSDAMQRFLAAWDERHPGSSTSPSGPNDQARRVQ